jgi:Predicted transcriptional regulator
MIRIQLSKILGEKRITQADLARRTGIGKNTICDLYNDIAVRVSLRQLDKICRVLNCDIADLLEYDPKKDWTD